MTMKNIFRLVVDHLPSGSNGYEQRQASAREGASPKEKGTTKSKYGKLAGRPAHRA